MIFKCKMCGGDITPIEGKNIGQCEYCKSIMTLPNLDNERIVNLYNRANSYRLENKFDKAYEIYENILELDGKQLEARWGLLLCKYGVEYVDDPNDNKKVPTCHRTITTSILKDIEYRTIEKEANGEALELYQNEAEKINKIQKRILEISSNENPYDIFICYKESDSNSERTHDSVIAEDIYEKLIEKGYKVFFARITLEDKLGSEYEPYIYSALSTAKVMLVVGTSEENFNATWVRNEWSRYLEMMKTDKTKNLIPVYSKIDAYKMPEEFAMLQAQSMDKIGAIQDLLRGIDKLVQPKEENVTKDIYEKLQHMLNEAKVKVDTIMLYEGPENYFIFVAVLFALLFCVSVIEIFLSVIDFRIILRSLISHPMNFIDLYYLKNEFVIGVLFISAIIFVIATIMNFYRKYFKISKWMFFVNCLLDLISIIGMICLNINFIPIFLNLTLLIINISFLLYDHKWIIKFQKTQMDIEAKKKQDLKNEEFKRRFSDTEKSILNPNILRIISLILVVFSIMVLLFYRPAIQENGKNAENIQIQISTEYIRVREEPSTQAKHIGTVHKDEIYNIISIEKNKNRFWYKIEMNTGIIGYILYDKDNYFKVLLSKGNKIMAKEDLIIKSNDKEFPIYKDEIVDVVDVSSNIFIRKSSGEEEKITEVNKFVIVEH